jgi:hypothetical protein
VPLSRVWVVPDCRHKTWQPEGQLSKLGNHACYDPNKVAAASCLCIEKDYTPANSSCCLQDLTVPLMWSPNKYKDSPMLGAPTRERHILAFFKGKSVWEAWMVEVAKVPLLC